MVLILCSGVYEDSCPSMYSAYSEYVCNDNMIGYSVKPERQNNVEGFPVSPARLDQPGIDYNRNSAKARGAFADGEQGE